MKDYLEKREWSVVESGFHARHNKITESIFSLGNGYMGLRGMFEEKYTGPTLQGTYLAGIYYPDKTRVGWWKNGYPEYFAKVLNSVFWIGVDVLINDEVLDLSQVEFLDFERELDMRHSMFRKNIRLRTKEGYHFNIKSERFCSAKTKELGLVKYSIQSEDYLGKFALRSYLDFDVFNEDSNYDESFWHDHSSIKIPYLGLTAKTHKSNFTVLSLMDSRIEKGDVKKHSIQQTNNYIADVFEFEMEKGSVLSLEKRVIIDSSFNTDASQLRCHAVKLMDGIKELSYEDLYASHRVEWDLKWEQSDIVIDGDLAAQQGIRFNIFHLNQTYTGVDDRLNIGPKGFTGEKYGGSTYWDTEAYCLPFYMSTSEESVSRNLLIYRYKHLQKAIENAEKLGFKGGAALYPMVTINGEECHNEWEITFEEIHRNGAIAYAIYDYINYTGTKSYLLDYGTEVLIAIARFWAQRVNFSNGKKAYVILGVTGPNEYENNVNNNWYTNYIAKWCLEYTLECIEYCKQTDSSKYASLLNKINFKEAIETEKWKDIIQNMYFPFDSNKAVFLQQDGFLDKEIVPVSDLDESHLPINQKWSWDRILRSCYIKQADVLQGIYFFEDHFDLDTIKRNFDFYEPLTVHESSLSPCVHNILACVLDKKDKAYEMYLRTSRLDLDDYNNDTEDGLHITSMAGTWMSIVKGFAGMRIKNQQIEFTPKLPKQWKSLEFKIRFKNGIIDVLIKNEAIRFLNKSNETLELMLYGEHIQIEANGTAEHQIGELVKT